MDQAGAADDGMEALYAAAYSRLVAVVTAVGRDRVEAEEAVQEAFVRLIGQWPRVSRYDDPEAWLRKVALGFLSKRQRSLHRGLRALSRHGAAGPAPGPDGNRVDLDRALGVLPRIHREVIVLQHLGLDVAEIARTLNIPVGTVKSRLSRARNTLGPLLTEDVKDHA